MNKNKKDEEIEYEKISKERPKWLDKLKLVFKANRKFGILLDSIRGFLIAATLFILIVFFASAIIHNLLRVFEASDDYTGKYKKLYTAGEGMINLYSQGSSERTIIILPSLGDSSPLMKYKALADSLSSNYKVVIAEPLGYGYSLSTSDPRTSKNIVKELRQALQEANISGPYTLLTFANSSIYADYYSEQYPAEINGIISINGLYPESLENDTFKNKYLPNVITNVKFFSAVSFSGLYRWQTYTRPEKFNIDKMQELDSYDEEDIKLYRNRIANKFLTKEMRKEVKKLQDNMSEMKDFKYNESLTTLQIITTDYRDEYLDRQENISKYASNLITNKNIQKIRTLEDSIETYLFTDKGIRELKSLINMYF